MPGGYAGETPSIAGTKSSLTFHLSYYYYMTIFYTRSTKFEKLIVQRVCFYLFLVLDT